MTPPFKDFPIGSPRLLVSHLDVAFLVVVHGKKKRRGVPLQLLPLAGGNMLES
jgi:hypothetical protein